ncbi:DUF2202 domain-containing protein [Sulfurovum sp.]|uniref:DUF2202 domain-containing protein n=1 Tax=Sulfurovum sp. TaxID=1969726 RepID=UPI0035641488
MKKNILKSLMVAGAVLTVIGCGGGSTLTGEGDIPTTDVPTVSILPDNVQAAIDGPASTLDENLTNTLSYMGNEERLAYDVYNALDEQYPTIKQFKNIATNGEYQHITAVQALIQKYKLSDDVNFTNIDLPALGYMNTAIEDMKAGTYDISVIQELYDNLVLQGSASEKEALKVGCIIEVVDIIDLDHDIKLAEDANATDIVTVFNFLRNGSYNHYWAFDGALKNLGSTEGCCPAALEILGGTVCPDYPKK